MFFKESDKKLKDPDTYAALNYIFIAGLHHFYLGKWQRGLLNIVVFWTGIICLFNGYTSIGVIIITAITILELYELFQSEIIVKEHNNSVMEQIYHDVQKA
jgi:TM2 domain-containing membrane protein YozV